MLVFSCSLLFPQQSNFQSSYHLITATSTGDSIADDIDGMYLLEINLFGKSSCRSLRFCNGANCLNVFITLTEEFEILICEIRII